ncbi:MAG: nucleotide pyrophosphohydrolase [Desulfobulbaceae bacterium]|nr:nucleotide pyrophosphohydrolase [Desulfobulbaceae bacterium]
MSDSLDHLTQAIRSFADDRNWEQFHSPKNLATALVVEAGELVEHFQWLTQDQSRTLSTEAKEAVAMEMADVLIYLCRLSEQLDVDLLAAAERKIAINEKKYPVEQAIDSCQKYTAWKKKS